MKQFPLGSALHQRTAHPVSSVHLDDIGAAPAGIAVQPDQPGAFLHDVLAHVQKHVPSATGLMVRDGRLVVAYAQPPDEEARAASRAALADEAVLAELATRRASSLAPASEPTSAELRAPLLDAKLPDAAWLRAFRRYQVALLSAAEPTSAPADDKPATQRRDGESE